jgi:hypothetical protein
MASLIVGNNYARWNMFVSIEKQKWSNGGQAELVVDAGCRLLDSARRSWNQQPHEIRSEGE